MEGVLAAFAQFDNDVRSERVRAPGYTIFVARTAYLPRDANTRIAKTTMNTAMTSRISLVIVI